MITVRARTIINMVFFTAVAAAIVTLVLVVKFAPAAPNVCF